MLSASWESVLTALADGADFNSSSASWVMGEVMQGRATDAQTAGLLIGLAMKSPTTEEVIGLRNAALQYAGPVTIGPDAVDIVGTGGDPYGVTNISSVAAVIVAAAGVPVIKHGNRAASSVSGASDLLGTLGVDVMASAKQIEDTFTHEGIAYLHAASFHPGFRHAAQVREELGVPTIFNLLGPLCNPARPNATAIGISANQPLDIAAGVFQRRGATALVYRDELGIDKLTTIGGNQVVEIFNGEQRLHEIDPRDLGLPKGNLSDILGGSPVENATVARKIFDGGDHPTRDTILLNASAAVVAYELSRDSEQSRIPILDRFAMAYLRLSEVVSSGQAKNKLDRWRRRLAPDFAE